MTQRTAEHGVDPAFLARWSPRAFTGEPIPDDVLMSLFEAARWAPSAFNIQPWRFVYARCGTSDWDRLFATLIPFNQAWTQSASALVFVISDRFRRKPGAEPQPNYSHSFDAGAAWAFLALQAHHLGWAAHGMSGFDPAAASEALGLDAAQFRVEAAVALGRPALAAALPDNHPDRQPRSARKPLSDLAFDGRLRP